MFVSFIMLSKGINMENKDIFISYKSEEFDDALWVKNTLEKNGISCWMAPMCISGGASYATEIPNAIKNCKVFVLILSEKVQESKWVPRELDQAINLDKIIMPFMLEDCALKNDFAFYLTNVQRYSAYFDKEAAMAKMLEDIKNYLGYKEPEIVPVSEEATETITQPESEEKTTEEVNTQSIKNGKPAALTPKVGTTKKTNKQKPKGKGKKIIPAIVCIVVVLAVLIGSIIVKQSQKITVADMAFEKNDYSVEIDGKIIDSDDMLALAEFENLSFLSFTNCTFDMENLNTLSAHDLSSLVLENCSLTDAQLKSLDFKALENLTELNLNGNEKITNFDVLSPLADSLTALYINGTSPASLDLIEDFTKIEQLSMNNVGISSLSILNKMAYLEILEADGNNIETLNGLENATILSKVSLKNNNISDVSILAKSAESLKYLYLDNNNISDLSGLANCKNIIGISASFNKLTSVEWLSEWNALQTVLLSNNSIESASGFIKSENLTYLDLSNNKLTKIDGIVFEADGYIEVNLSNNGITSVTLPNNCHFSKLALHGNPLTDDSFLSKTKGSDVSFNFFNELNPKILETAEFYNIYIADCPTDRRVEVEQASYKVTLTTANEIEKLIFEE